MHVFERKAGGQYRAPVAVGGLDDPRCARNWTTTRSTGPLEELEMLALAGEGFDEAAVLAGQTTPVFFGSGINNFGVQLLLDGLLKYSPPPRARVMAGVAIAPEQPHFSGFIFKIQANMDPAAPRSHRVCARLLGQVRARHDRAPFPFREEGASVQLAQALRRRTRDASTKPGPAMSSALSATTLRHRRHADHRPGDRLPRNPAVRARGVRVAAQSQHRQVQAIPAGTRPTDAGGRDPGALPAPTRRPRSRCWPRLGRCNSRSCNSGSRSEYGAASRLETAPWTVVRWLPSELTEDDLYALSLPSGAQIAHDMGRNTVVLFTNEWSANYFAQTNPRVKLSHVPAPARPG